MKRTIVVLRRIYLAAAQLIFSRRIPQHRRRRPALHHRRRIHQRFQRRAGLPFGQRHIHLAVNRLIVVIRRADHRQHLVGFAIQHNHRTVAGLLIADFADARFHFFLRCILPTRIERRGDTQSAAIQQLRAITSFKLFTNVKDKMRRAQTDVRRLDIQRFIKRGLRLLLGDKVVANHRFQHNLLPGFRAGRVDQRIEF